MAYGGAAKAVDVSQFEWVKQWVGKIYVDNHCRNSMLFQLLYTKIEAQIRQVRN